MISRELRSIIVALAVLLIVAILIPFDLTVAPERTLKVVNERGDPFANALVRQIWKQYALNKGAELDITPDMEGRVLFPKRSIRTNILSLVMGSIKEFLKLGIHASYGSTERICVVVSGYKDKWFYNGSALESSTVIIMDE